jgi:DNA-3-methyladenine glycosylase I
MKVGDMNDGMKGNEKKRCDWSSRDPLMIEYHDREWGMAVHDDRKLFEFIVLEGAEAGLSWLTVLKKRDSYREAFDGFDFNKVAYYDKGRIRDLVANEGIIRNRLKIESAIINAKAVLRVIEEFGSLDEYLWQFVGGKTIENSWKNSGQIPTTSKVSDRMSEDMISRGFKFAGSTICYAHMQATGMVNDHLISCFRHKEV